MKTHQIWRTIRNTGIQGVTDKALLHRIILVNSLSFTICFLVFSIGIIYFVLSKEISIVVAASIEFSLAASAIVLNYYRKYTSAALVTYFVQCLASTYFGLKLGAVIELQAMVIFLFLITFLLFQDKLQRVLCLIAAVIILVVIEYNYYSNFVAPIRLDERLTIIFKALSIFGVLLLILLVGRPYVQSNDENHELTRANNFKRIFIYQITHELRTQLNAVYYIAQLIKREIKLDAHLKKIDPYIDLLFTVVGNTRNIINNVLDMSKIEAGKMEDIQEETFELKPFFERLIAVHKITAKARNIQIQLQIDEQLSTVIVCDSFKLSQVVANLLSNAVKYADRNSTVMLKLQQTDESHWQLQVVNKGFGIAQDKLAAIFDMFVTNKQNRYTEGTGLGLYIVKNMVLALDGEIYASSKPGAETSFTVQLPLKTGRLTDVPEGNTEEEIDLSNVNILVADDNEMNNMLFSQYLTMCGCSVISAVNGLEVIQKLEKDKQLPDVILLDHQMPEMDGAVTLHHLKKDPRLQHIPVIICTGSFEFQEALLSAGASAIVIKPIDQKSLFKVISQHLPHINGISTD